MNTKNMRHERLPTATDALEALCRRQFGKPLDDCHPGHDNPAQIRRALSDLRSELEMVAKSTDAFDLYGEEEELDCDRVIASMTATGSLDPFRFIPANSQQMVCSTIEVVKDELMSQLFSKRLTREIPAQLTGRNLGLAALAVHVLRP